ncbi:MAG: hypothetical protein J6Y03_02250 [Alphaproteobacteria bacterium]|nr:hypothetical protein [Alphaproteobacteria bacterium]
MFFRKKKNNAKNLNLEPGSVFVKNDCVPSTFIVEKILDFSPAPMHVRLKEHGGNGRTITVALETLLDEHFWHHQPKE